MGLSWRKIPWWALPTAFSLDAPMVAVSWSCLLSKYYEIKISFANLFTLAGVVWLIYAADRWLDVKLQCGKEKFQPQQLTWRHLLHWQYRSHLRTVWAMVFLSCVCSMFFLTVAELVIGSCLSVCVLVYFVGVHWSVWATRSPYAGDFKPIGVFYGAKEMAVGALFASGVHIPIAAAKSSDPLSYIPTWIGLACLCTLNCLSITSNEQLHSTFRQRFLFTIISTLFTLVLAIPFIEPHVSWLIAGCAVFQFGLYLNRHNMQSEGFRVLADALLVIPTWMVMAFPD